LGDDAADPVAGHPAAQEGGVPANVPDREETHGARGIQIDVDGGERGADVDAPPGQHPEAREATPP